MLLLLLQAAAQHTQAVVQAAPPQVFITVQQPAGGMPEWVKILITAGVGALFGVGSALITENVKTRLAKERLKKAIAEQLTAEMEENLDHVETCTEILITAARAGQLDLDSTFAKVKTNARYIDDDRYKHYFVSEKLLVYEIDPDKELADFYNHLKLGMEGIDEVDGAFATASFKLAVLLGFRFLRSQGINHTRRPHLSEQLHQEAVDGTATPPIS
jgi:hypothetical protein